MKTVKRKELTTLKMVEGNEKIYDYVIMDGVLNHWVGIGWVEVHKATEKNHKQYPTMID